jgi:hypothetical protein
METSLSKLWAGGLMEEFMVCHWTNIEHMECYLTLGINKFSCKFRKLAVKSAVVDMNDNILITMFFHRQSLLPIAKQSPQQVNNKYFVYSV